MYITSQTELEEYIPNVLAAAEGEKSLFEKIEKYLKLAEIWLNMNVADHATVSQLISDEDSRADILKRIVALDAFYRAIPSLDLVLTPNGFGIVSNSNIAPASKERVASLRDSLLQERDLCINEVVTELHGYELWTSSIPGKRFGEMIIQNLLISVECGEDAPSFKFWIEHRREMLGVQRMLAINFVSKEIMSLLCSHILSDEVADEETELINMISHFIISSLREECEKHPHELEDMVNYIKGNETLFAIWKESDTALLFEDQSFENKKESGGYWL